MKKTLVSPDDYELYKIPLPWNFFFRRNGNSLIVSELERMHPRFSLNCCYDAKFFLERRNLMADVVVMEKSRVAEYKHSGGELYIEKENGRNVFSGKARLVRFLTLLLVLFAGLLTFRIVISVLSAQKTHVELVASPEPEMSLGDSEEESQKITAPKEIVSEVFASVSRRGGKISAFAYTAKPASLARGGNGKCSFSIYGCNSEEVANARYCVVSFKDNEPHFELVIPFSIPDFSAADSAEKALEEGVAGIPSIRKRLRSVGATIESEHDGEDKAEMTFLSAGNNLYSCLKVCSEEIENFGWPEESVQIAQNGSGVRVSLGFSKNPSKSPSKKDSDLLQLCAQYAYLMVPELKVIPKKTVFTNPLPVPQKALPSQENKIGEIRRRDGSIFVCYRGKNGKISYEKKEAVNAR